MYHLIGMFLSTLIASEKIKIIWKPTKLIWEDEIRNLENIQKLFKVSLSTQNH